MLEKSFLIGSEPPWACHELLPRDILSCIVSDLFTINDFSGSAVTN